MQNADIGTVPSEGGASFQNGKLRVQGSGQGIAQAGDSFHYVWQANQGDYSVISKISPSADSEGAIVIRETEDPVSPGLWLGFTQTGKINLVLRPAKSGPTAATEFDAAGSDPIWVRVVRTGDIFSFSSSEDGITWDSFHEVSLILPNRSLAGFAVSGTNATATFESFEVMSTGQVEQEGLNSDSGAAPAMGTLQVSGEINQSRLSSGTEKGATPSPSTGGVADSIVSAPLAKGKRKIYVNKNLGSDTNDGLVSLRSGVKGPKKTIEAALALARGGDEIIVTAGTYTLTELKPNLENVTLTAVGEVIITE